MEKKLNNRQERQRKRLETMIKINEESPVVIASLNQQIDNLIDIDKMPDVFIDRETVHYTNNPPCGKHLTDDVLEDIEFFLYVNIKSDVTCNSCIEYMNPTSGHHQSS